MVPAHGLDDFRRKFPLFQSFGAHFVVAATGEAYFHFRWRTTAIGEALEAFLEGSRHDSEGQAADIVDQAGQKGLRRIYFYRRMQRHQLGGLCHIQAVVPKLVRLWRREVTSNGGSQQHPPRGLGADIGDGLENGPDGHAEGCNRPSSPFG